MFQVTPRFRFMKSFVDNRPRAYAQIHGDSDYPGLQGAVYFYEASNGGVLVEAEIFGLPDFGSPGMPAFYGFHIHENGDCSNRFQNAGGHFNPENRKHPYHAGDMPPLFSADGYAWTAFFNDALELYDIVGRSVIIHRDADDFTTQPSGGAGEMIGCGVIRLADEKQS